MGMEERSAGVRPWRLRRVDHSLELEINVVGVSFVESCTVESTCFNVLYLSCALIQVTAVVNDITCSVTPPSCVKSALLRYVS
jgi:hypothetical protein